MTVNYPECGEPNYQLINVLRYWKSLGATIILWTCREGEHLKIAIDWCKKYDIPIDYFNENCPQRIKMWDNDSRKIGADYYIDDKSITLWDISKINDEMIERMF